MTENAPISERELIETYLRPLTKGAKAALDLKDDAALLEPPTGHQLVISKDLLVEGVHFLSQDSAANIGFKALAVNISDMNAKAASPLGYFLGLSLPAPPTPEWMQDFCTSLDVLGSAFNCPLLGGDITGSKGGLVLSITVMGSVEAGKMVKRSTAGAGDQIFVTGSVGDAFLGLQLMQSPSLQDKWHLTDEEVKFLRHRYCHPIPRGGANALLKQHASAAIDLSDGLVSDLEKLCAASEKSAEISLASIPLSEPLQKAIKAEPTLFDQALSWGDDYEILAAIPEEGLPSFTKDVLFSGVTMTNIGTIKAENAPPKYFNDEGLEQTIKVSPYHHF